MLGPVLRLTDIKVRDRTFPPLPCTAILASLPLLTSIFAYPPPSLCATAPGFTLERLGG